MHMYSCVYVYICTIYTYLCTCVCIRYINTLYTFVCGYGDVNICMYVCMHHTYTGFYLLGGSFPLKSSACPPNLQVLLPNSVYSGLQNSCHVV